MVDKGKQKAHGSKWSPDEMDYKKKKFLLLNGFSQFFSYSLFCDLLFNSGNL